MEMVINMVVVMVTMAIVRVMVLLIIMLMVTSRYFLSPFLLELMEPKNEKETT